VSREIPTSNIGIRNLFRISIIISRSEAEGDSQQCEHADNNDADDSDGQIGHIRDTGRSKGDVEIRGREFLVIVRVYRYSPLADYDRENQRFDQEPMLQF
jgi:hypothetical protein